MFESIIRPSQPKREQDDPKEAHQDLKETKKTAVPQTLKKQWIFSTFLNTDTSQEGIQDTRGSQKRHKKFQNIIQRYPKSKPQKIYIFIKILEDISVPIN